MFSWSGSLLVRTWCGGRAALNQHLFKVTSEKYPKWFYLHCLLSHFPEFQRIAADKATTMGHIKRHHLADAVCVAPPDRVITRVFRFARRIVGAASGKRGGKSHADDLARRATSEAGFRRDASAQRREDSRSNRMTATLLTGPDQKEGLSLVYVKAWRRARVSRRRCRSPIWTASTCGSWQAGRVVRPLTCN